MNNAPLVAEAVTQVINILTSRAWLLVLLGLMIVGVQQRQGVMAFAHARHKSFKLAQPVLEKLKYLGIGVLLVYGAYAIVNLLTRFMIPDGMTGQIELQAELQRGTLLGILKFYAGFTGLVLTFLIVLSGLFLIPSAGNKWMVTVSKTLLTLAVLYLVFMTVVILV